MSKPYRAAAGTRNSNNTKVVANQEYLDLMALAGKPINRKERRAAAKRKKT